jgi:uncharacterized membrane protein (DUF106 family)
MLPTLLCAHVCQVKVSLALSVEALHSFCMSWIYVYFLCSGVVVRS